MLEKIDIIKNTVPYGDRSNSIIEPLLTEQWFADAKFLSKKAIEVVKKKKTNFFPTKLVQNLLSVDETIYNLGVYLDNCGGDTEFPLGTLKTKKFLLLKMNRKLKKLLTNIIKRTLN